MQAVKRKICKQQRETEMHHLPLMELGHLPAISMELCKQQSEITAPHTRDLNVRPTYRR